MDPDEFRRLGRELIEWVAAYRERVAEYSVMSRVEPGEIESGFATEPPMRGEGLETLVADLERLVLPGITHWNHPGFFAYFPSNADLSSVLADIVSTGLGSQGMSWQTSPAATEVENVVMEWLRQMVGLPETFGGVIHDTASTATLCALLCARERTTDFGQEGGGLQDGGAPLVVYASDQAHSSIAKAALLAGFGRDHLRLIESDDEHALRVDLLEAAVRGDLEAGRRPCAVVATVGSTATTALDPLADIAAVTERHGLWLHVDAALAGSAMICPELRWMWRGVEAADSLVFNPHKWLGTAFDLSAYYASDPEHLVRVMGTDPSYLRTAQDGVARNLRDWGIPLGRRFRALKLWLLIREYGVEGLQARIRRDIANAQWLKVQVDAEPGWERLAPVPLQTVCLRHVPERLRGDQAALTAHNLALAGAINRGGRYYLTPSLLKGRQMIRVSIGAMATEREQVEGLWDELRRLAVEEEGRAT
ncbi:MAG TPA: pyridoxal-dependent decarboxylase [Thermoleophilia bacterium]|nr:pyridoxal-dependent decarboxylase [Thermoleophilia bacterium]